MKQLTIKGEKVLNVPNLLSLYRLLVFPVILYMALTGRESTFVVLLCISLVSDILDGNIARIFHLQTHFGAALDNLADIVTYAMALLGLFLFKWTDIEPHAWVLYLFLTVFVISYFVSFVRFGKIPGLHLYSAVSAGYLQGVFFFVLFVYGFIPWFYYLAVGWGAIAYIEKIFVLLKLDDIKIGVKGLYWLMRDSGKR
ncbi:CDP-alcohol phosphatidyltransferase family protein [Thermophagus xiamenensis]|jgi:phosphatidylglycerophosphate synthase|uniref:CDP-diacylglycerol--glycerol-3-phosphate 3-phosphatidyltransferase/cardiolipin synthase n=1 Tax=Thermophagus xiamenensis TaxID=385682 RepID=A0A1I2DKG0_9BACT|nr:CDP-alcohol phosphatidyltransferase family protein [Thermophagus xiamenensis]SFE80781.1 CDP-diacylglycerol--glycerol-3-phosphate 3-phosphatidyltransferase/cardiolipin synthase [Thermophagus xiamenensis]